MIRCLSLARQLKDVHQIETCFYSRPYHQLEALYQENDVNYEFEGRLSEVDFLSRIARASENGLLFLDQLFPYPIDTIRRLKEHLKIIMFHNECEGMFYCNYAVFPSAHLRSEIINDPRWGSSPASLLYGPEYVIINQVVQETLRGVTSKAAKPFISITTGASDPNGVLLQLLKWINVSEIDIPVKALIGRDFLHEKKLKGIAPEINNNIELKRFNYGDLLTSRLAISTFGVTTYELIYANIPVISLGHARKNAQGSKILADRYGCVVDLGYREEIKAEDFLDTVRGLWNSPGRLSKLKASQEGLIDGRGLDRLGKLISNCLNTWETTQ